MLQAPSKRHFEKDNKLKATIKYQPAFPRKSIPTTTETEVPTARVK